MENIRLQQRVDDLENALIKIKHAMEDIQKMDNSHINALSFQDGFKHAANLATGVAGVYVDAVLCP